MVLGVRLSPLASKAHISTFWPSSQPLCLLFHLFLFFSLCLLLNNFFWGGHFILYLPYGNHWVSLRWEGILQGLVLANPWGGWSLQEMGTYPTLEWMRLPPTSQEATSAAHQPPAPQSWGKTLTQSQMAPSSQPCFHPRRRNVVPVHLHLPRHPWGYLTGPT